MAKRRKLGRRGFGSVFQKGATWYVRVRAGERGQKRRSVVRSAGPTRSHAEGLLEKLRQEQADLAVFDKAPPLPETSLAGFRATFEAARAGLAPETRRADAQRYAVAADYFGAKALRDFTRPNIEDFLSHLSALGRSGSTRNRFLNLLSAVFKAAVERGLAIDNPCRGIRRSRETLRDVSVVSAAELERLALHVTPPELRPAVVLATETGCRRSELVAATWEDVDVAMPPRGALLIRRGKSARARRAIPLTARARAIVDALKTERDAVPLRGALPLLAVLHTGERAFNRLSRAVPRAARAAGLPALRLHDLRHLYAVRLVRAGVPLNDVAALLGDTLAVVCARYARHVPADAGAQAVARLESAERAKRRRKKA